MRSLASILALSLLTFTLPGQAAQSKKSVPESGASRGAALYHNYCSVCHGDRGNGNSRATGSLNPPPRDFTSVALGREHMLEVTRNGKPGTAMAGWSTQLSEKDIATVVDYVRATFMQLVLDPKLQRGKLVYAEHCKGCHGERGEGAVNPAIGMNQPPKDLTTPQARQTFNRKDMIFTVQTGRSGTFMTAYRERLPQSDIEAVVDYIRAALMLPESEISGTSAHANKSSAGAPDGAANMNLPLPGGLKPDLAKGKSFYHANCATCHGDKGDGQGPRAYFINPKPANFTAEKYRGVLNRPTIYTIIAAGKLGTEMPAWRYVMTEQEMANVTEYVFKTFIAGSIKQAKSGK